jgi:hypothetical protein
LRFIESKAFRMSKNTKQFIFPSSMLFKISSHILMRADKVSVVPESQTDTLREDYFHSRTYTFA